MKLNTDAAEIAARLRRVRLLALDVDGVLTSGALYYSDSGEEMKAFCVLDGQGIKLLQDNGIAVAIISGRNSPLLARRARATTARRRVRRRRMGSRTASPRRGRG